MVPVDTELDRLSVNDRLIVALDVPTAAEAEVLVEKLDVVSFFKVGLQLFLAGLMSGDLRHLLDRLRQKHLFLDLKVPGDIGNTVGAVIDVCVQANVKFLTLSESMPRTAIEAARAARGMRQNPRLLLVPYLSSLNAEDLTAAAPGVAGKVSLDEHIAARAETAIDAGCDGLIVSGQAIQTLRKKYPKSSGIILVSPGIRPAGTSSDDHKRHTTPGEAIRLGADYLVVGRPIRSAPDPCEAARRIIDEIDQAAEEGRTAPLT
jgi:orotidine-5'-phosphate decarboxylase